ncbi:MAG: hypothetical protein GY937_20215 [bacterium]|nr:hypothetical protein [bacterium]
MQGRIRETNLIQKFNGRVTAREHIAKSPDGTKECRISVRFDEESRPTRALLVVTNQEPVSLASLDSDEADYHGEKATGKLLEAAVQELDQKQVWHLLAEPEPGG